MSNMENHSASFSKRGTGMMASKDRRLMKLAVSAGPSPGDYSVNRLPQDRQDFSRSDVSRVFHLPIAVERPKSTGPAPNQYDTQNSPRGRTNNVHASAAFKSTTKRENLFSSGARSKPSPCQYDVKDSVIRDSVRVPVSSFKSKTGRQFPPAPSAGPGPGQYKPYESPDPVKRTLLPRHNYLCLSVPAMPLPPAPAPPGPASYNVPSSFDVRAKSDAGSSAFASTTKRWSAETSLTNSGNFPSPAHYNPMPIGKQSFIFNSSSRWL